MPDNLKLNKQEQILQAEKKIEQPIVDIETFKLIEKEEFIDQEARSAKDKIMSSGIISAGQQQTKKQLRAKQIEKILEKNLEEIYLNMPSNKQREFKIVGEQITQKINDLLDKTKVKINKIINLIKKWLSIIPGVNKFFLEQDAKIKADEILKINY